VVDAGAAASYREGDLIAAMVGEELSTVFPPRRAPCGDVVLDVRGLTGRRVRDVAFTIRRGEVLGIAGLAGSGRSELLRLLGAAGVAIVPEDRGRHMVVLDTTAAET
jgi:ABC-type sugar transport system ATPase subunit